MELSDLERERLSKVGRLGARGADPSPPRVERTPTPAEAIAAYEAAEPSQASIAATVTGRVVLFRAMGKASFAHLEDGAGRLQLYFRRDAVGDEAYQMLQKDIDLGDFIEAAGAMFRTKTGEVSLRVASFRLIAKAITPPPEKWHGLKDVETRYRQRYADLLSNPEAREVFRTRARIISALRRFLDDRDVMELTEEMITYAAREVLGTTHVEWGGHAIELAPPWPRISMREAILRHTGIDYVQHLDADALRSAIRAIGGPPPPPPSRAVLSPL